MKSFIEGLVAKKDLITSIVAIIQLVVVTVAQYMETLAGGEINYGTLIGSLAVAVVGWYTGKNKT
jgi:hypothetical protein